MQPKNIDQVFYDAARLASPAERAEYLDRACAGDPGLRREVEELLAARSAAGSFLETPAVGRPDCEADDAARTGPAGPDAELPPGFLASSDTPGALGRVGHYDVQEVVGRGGMGVVLKAFDQRLHRVVAVKVMAPHLAAVASARRRFAREGRAAAAVAHEHVVTIHAVEEADQLPYLVMQYVAGQSLQDRLDRSGPLPLTEVLRIGMQTASGLAAAHAQGLVHRDVKPANILLENGVERVKLTDFGLARAADDASLTQSGVIAGTPQYMSPEQAEGKPVDARSDLFSLGSVLYAMCTGRPPFRASSSMAVLKRVCEETATPIREVNPEAPDWLAEVIAKLHAKDPAGRFQSAAEVAEALGGRLAELQRPSAGAAVVARPPDRAGVVARSPDHATTPAAPRPRRWRRGALAAAVLACLFGGLGLTEATGVTKVAATVVRILTPDGTLVVQVDDPDVSVAIDGQDVVITGAGTKEIRLRPGRYTVVARKDGKVVRQELVTVEKNGREVVRVEREAAPAAEAAPAVAADPDRRAAEYVLSVGGTVQVNDMGGVLKAAADLPPGPFRLTTVSLVENQQVSDKGLASFQGCKNLTQLVLSDTQVGDEGLAYFQGCKNLTQLVLGGTQVGDEGLAYFQGCKNLTSLSLYHTRVTDAGMAYFQDCKNLTSLSLFATPVTDAGMANFKDCKNLTNLYLQGTQVGDEGLANFKDCKYLTSLNLYGARVTDAGLANFQDCKNLTRLVLDSTQVGDVGMANFKECKNLTQLVLGGTQVGDEGLANFKGCKNLTSLSLYGARVTDAGLANFQDCKNLTYLALYDTRVTDAGLAYFQDCKNLTVLTLQKTKVTAAGIDGLKKALPQCRIEWDGGVVERVAPAAEAAPAGAGDPDRRAAEYVLSAGGSVQINDVGGFLKAAADLPLGPFRLTAVSLWNSNHVSDKGLASFQGCKNLTGLSIQGVQVGDEGLANFQGCKNLTNLNLDGTRVGDKGMASFQGCKNLTYLSLSGTQVGDEGLASFQGCKNLTYLNLSNTRVTDAGLANFKDCKNLAVLFLQRTHVGDEGMASFKGCKSLTSLVLDSTQVGDEGMANFEGCKNLTILNLNGTQVGDEGLTSFQGCKNLTILSLTGTRVGDAGLANFKESKNLTSLSLYGTQVGDEGMANFEGCKNLTYLVLRGTQVGDEGLAHFKGCKDLTGLDLYGSKRVTDAGLAHFQGCKNLTQLVLIDAQVGDEGLANFKDCKNLTQLMLIGTRVTDAGLANIQDCKNLANLTLQKTKVTAAGVDELKKALPRCGIAWDGGVVVPH